MTTVHVKVVDGNAIVTTDFNVGKVFDRRDPENKGKMSITPHVQGTMRFIEQIIASGDVRNMNPAAWADLLGEYKKLIVMDALGLWQAGVEIDENGDFYGFKDDVQVETAEPEFYSLHYFLWEYHPRRRGDNKREVLFNETEFFTSKEAARSRYDELKKKFDYRTSRENTNGFLRLRIAERTPDGRLTEGYVVVDDCAVSR